MPLNGFASLAYPPHIFLSKFSDANIRWLEESRQCLINFFVERAAEEQGCNNDL